MTILIIFILTIFFTVVYTMKPIQKNKNSTLKNSNLDKKDIPEPPYSTLLLKKNTRFNKNYYYIWDYYPKRFEISNEDRMNREKIWDFKNGKKNNYFSTIIAKTIKIIVSNESFENVVILPIPASTNYSNNKRYYNVFYNISNAIGVENGYNYVEITEDREAKHRSTSPYQKEKNYILLSEHFKNKHVIIFDDVITSGKSFEIIANEIISLGAKSVCGLFLGRTISQEEYNKNYKIS